MRATVEADARDVVEVDVRSKGRVTLPMDVRDRKGIEEGDTVELVIGDVVDE